MNGVEISYTVRYEFARSPLLYATPCTSQDVQYKTCNNRLNATSFPHVLSSPQANTQVHQSQYISPISAIRRTPNGLTEQPFSEILETWWFIKLIDDLDASEASVCMKYKDLTTGSQEPSICPHAPSKRP